jgi:hypothetical protein
MKKAALVATIVLLGTLNTFAQERMSNQAEMGKPSLGLFGGVNFQNINGKAANGNQLTNTLVTKFHIGINGELPIAPDFFVQLGIQYMGKGSKGAVQFTDNAGNHTISRTLNLNYLEVPLHLIYKPRVGPGNFILGFGPYFGYAISGNAAFTGSNAPADSDLEFINTAPTTDVNNLIYFKRIDVGANIVVGYQLQNGIYLSLNSQLGLVPINSKTATDMVNKNTGFGLSLGYRL